MADNKRPTLGERPLRALTDLGNAERLIDDNRNEIRYVAPWKAWVIWDGTRWRRDDSQEIERRAQSTVRNIVGEIAVLAATQAQLPPDEQLPTENVKAWQKEIFKHAMASEGAARVRAMIHTAEPRVALAPSELDADPWLMNVRNGVIDLRSGKLLPHDASRFLTKRSEVSYDASAECPLWLAFLARIFDHEQPLIDYLQRAIGYTLTGITSEQLLHICHGAGANGKSTFLETLSRLLGDYAVAADFTAFLDNKQSGPREDLARLAGARLVRSSEVGEGKKLNEPLIRSLTGNETVAARFLYSSTFEFQPTFKLWLAVNHKPVIRGTDYATWRRIRLVPFLVTIPLDDRDQMLGEKLARELPGILNWAIAGCLAWQKEGLKAPGIVQLVSDQYRSESDILGAFLDDCCEFGGDCNETSRDLYNAYKRWCDDNGEVCVSQTQFGRKLEERGFLMSRVAAGKRRNGLKLRPSEVPNGASKPWF